MTERLRSLRNRRPHPGGRRGGPVFGAGGRDFVLHRQGVILFILGRGGQKKALTRAEQRTPPLHLAIPGRNLAGPPFGSGRRLHSFTRPGVQLASRAQRVIPSSEGGGRNLPSPDRLRRTLNEPASTPSSSREPELLDRVRDPESLSAVRKAGLAKPAICHTLCHSFATHPYRRRRGLHSARLPYFGLLRDIRCAMCGKHLAEHSAHADTHTPSALPPKPCPPPASTAAS
jgi:hypothetical protein